MNNSYIDYSVVIEQTSPEDNEVKILETHNSKGLNYLRFETILQAFVEERNRNRRKWVPKYVKEAINGVEFMELINNGGLPGENGHPVPKTGQVTLERIATIDPNNISHVIKKAWFTDGDRILRGVIETVDDDNGPGRKFMKNILQGLPTSFSNRAIIPQRKNVDGTIDQTGVGRIITFDRVFLPSHKEAYRDINIPIVNVIKSPEDMKIATECCSYIIDKSSNVRNVLDNMDPALESAYIDKKGRFNVKTDDGLAIIPIEQKLVREISSYMMNL